MAKTYGYGLQAFAGSFQKGLGLGMENKKIKMLQEEQKRAEKLAKEKEENAMNWLNTNKDSLMNFHTQPQDTRNMLIFESTQYKKEWTDYLRDVEDFLQSGDLEGLKSLNDMEEERIKAERDMLGLGIRPENAFVGKYYSEKDMEYVKKLQMGKLPIKPIGMKMYEEEFGKLPEEEPTMADEKSAINLLRSFIRATPEQYEKQRTNLEQRTGLDLSMYTQEILREEGSEFFNLYDTPEEVIASVKAPAGLTVIPKRDTKTGKYYGSFSKETIPKPTPEGEITAGEKRTYDMASSIIFGSSDWVTGISKPGIISTMISNKLNMGQPLTEEENAEVRNNYNLIKGTLPGEVISMVESQLQRYGISLEAPATTPEPTVTPEPEPKKWWEFWKGETKPTTTIKPEITPEAREIPTPKVPTKGKEALIPLMSKKELEDAIKGLDPSDPIYKLLYDEAVKRGYITK